MKPEAGGARHCQNCKKSVTDFTTMTDHQIVQHLKANPTACGRFAVHQVDRDLQPYYPEAKPTQWRIAKWAMAASVFFAAAPAAWARPFAEMEYAAGDEKEAGDSTKVTLHGRVCDDKGYPAIGAMVQVLQGGVTKNGAAVRNEDGTFEIKNLKPGAYEVWAEFIGYEKCVTSVLIDKSHNSELMLNLKQSRSTELIETVVLGKGLFHLMDSRIPIEKPKKRNWFQRMIHRK